MAGDPKHQAPREQWAREAQEGEFAFHAANQWRRSPQFVDDNARLWGHFGFEPDQYCGRSIVDLGSGGRLRTRYFLGARIFAVDPLASRYLSLDFCDLSYATACYSLPAETIVPALVDQADAVLSINALDHAFDFDAAINACARYLKPGRPAFLSFDIHETADAMHPLLLREESCRQLFDRCGLSVERLTNGLGPLGAKYGHGEAINFWLRKL